MPLEDIKRFRQLDSKCPGHPEYRWTSGVETTTGPLGQGVATSVGMALAGQWMARRYNKPDFTLFDFNVYAVCGDGCMMEGISGEAASLAGHLQLPNLCWIYDNNHITIEGNTALAFSDDVATRFIGYGWNVTRVGDANDLDMLSRAFRTFQKTTGRPTLIIVDSHIAFGAPNKQDTSGAHGEPLGEEEIKGAKRNFGWPEDAKFLVPPEVPQHFKEVMGKRGGELRNAWFEKIKAYKAKYPELADELYRMQHRQLPAGWDKDLPQYPADPKGAAGRDVSGKVLNILAKNVPWLIGGSADLAPSTKTRLTFPEAGDFGPTDHGGRNLHFGIREHATGAILNGMALVKVRPYGSGFLIFSDYSKPAIRLAAIMEIPIIWIFTHDSIGVGEDGPTHQPVEQLAAFAGDSGADHAAAGRRQRGGRGVEGHHAAAPRAGRADPVAAGDADGGPDQVRLGVRRGQGRLHSGRFGRDSGGDIDGNRQRGGALRRRLRAAEEGGRQGAGGVDAVVGAVRPPAARVPRQRVAADGDGAGGGGAGLDVRLDALHRPDRRVHRHANLRGVGAAEGVAEEVRLHAGEGDGSGEAPAGAVAGGEEAELNDGTGRPRSQLFGRESVTRSVDPSVLLDLAPAAVPGRGVSSLECRPEAIRFFQLVR